MAFAKAKEVKDSQPFSKYLGAVVAHLVGINPTKEEIEKITGRKPENDPVYVTECEVVDVKGTKKQGNQNSLSLWFSVPNPAPKAEDGSDATIFISTRIFLQNSARIGSQSGKIQIVDKYGRFAWATPSEYESKSIPQYASGPANISPDYRAAMVGEEQLITFIKSVLGMSNPAERNADGTYRQLTEEELANRSDEFACSFEPQEIINVVKGNVKVIKDACEGGNDVKLILGVRHADKGDYQAVYGTIYKKNYNSLDKIEKEINENPPQNTEYFVDGHIPNGLVEYVVSPTKVTSSNRIEQKENDDLPF